MLVHTIKEEGDDSPCIKPQHEMPDTVPTPPTERKRDYTPPPTYSSQAAGEEFKEKPVFTAEPSAMSSGMRRRLVPETDGSSHTALAGASMSAAQPWTTAAFDDPEKALAHAQTLMPAAVKPRRYTARMASLLDSSLVSLGFNSVQSDSDDVVA